MAKKSVSAKRGPLKLTRLPAYRALATGGPLGLWLGYTIMGL